MASAREVIKGVRCNFCGMVEGVQCIIWNRYKSQPRPYPHAVRYSDYHELVHRQEMGQVPYECNKIEAILGNGFHATEMPQDARAKTIAFHATEYELHPPCTSQDCPSGPDCTDSCMVRAKRVARFYQEEKGSKVVRKREALERQLDRIMEEIDKLELMGEDIFDNDAVLFVQYKHHSNSETVYTYVCVKCADRWYMTGYQNQGPRSWDNIVEFFAKGEIVNMWMATDWVKML